ncbi:MAG: hypothetical protein AAGF19_05850 [Pseudomonadota bacterium]
MSKRLPTWLETRDAPLFWIEPGGYGLTAYAGGNADWMGDPQSAASIFGQVNSVLKSSILSIDGLPALRGGAPLEADADKAVSLAQDLLQDEAGKSRLKDVIGAVGHGIAGRAGLALALPSPAKLLTLCGAPAGCGDIEFDDLDDIAVALTGVARSVSETGIEALLVTFGEGAAVSDDEVEALESLTATASHYRWATAARLDGEPAGPILSSAFDIVLCPDCPPSHFSSDWTVEDKPLGGGLAKAFWEGEDFAALSGPALIYGEAPDWLAPEAVLARLNTLHGGAG